MATKVNLNNISVAISKMKSNVLKDVQKYTFTTFKRVFRQKTKLKQSDLSGDSLNAFINRKLVNKARGGGQTRQMLNGSRSGESPRQDKRKYLSNSVRYINTPDSAIVYLNVPFSKALDQGGISKVKQFVSPWSWQSLDILHYKGSKYYGKLFKGRELKGGVRAGFVSSQKDRKYFKTSDVRVQQYSFFKKKIDKIRTISARPFTGKVLSQVLGSGKIREFFKKNAIR